MTEEHYLILLSPGQWCAPWTTNGGRHGTTHDPTKAERFDTPEEAREKLKEQRRWSPYSTAEIHKLTITIELYKGDM